MNQPIFLKNAAQLITVAGKAESPRIKGEMSELNIIENGGVWIENETIIMTGPTDILEKRFRDRLSEAKIIEASGKIATPGLIDPHTHLVYAGSREKEFNQRLQGSTYMEIMNQGGGIHSTVRAVREASYEDLYKESWTRLNGFLLNGVTTVEAKSGYGLEWETEKKQLEVAKRLQENHPVDIVSTFMGAHAIPLEYKESPDRYIELLTEGMIPNVAGQKLAEFNDVFCEKGVFTPEQAKRILEIGKKFGLRAKIHADEIESYGGAELAADLDAISAEHLLEASETGMDKMAKAGVVAVLLPGTAYFLMKKFADARKIIDKGISVALSTDSNPGSSPTVSLPFIMNLACMKMGMTPEETVTAVTMNAAHAIGRSSDIGSIEPGKQADIAIFDVDHYTKLHYFYGMNHVDMVIKKGNLVVEGGRIIE